MSGPMAAVVALTVAGLLIAAVELLSRRSDRRWERRVRSNTRTIQELQRHEQRNG